MKITCLALAFLFLSACASAPAMEEGTGLNTCPPFPGCALRTWRTDELQANAWTSIVRYVTAEPGMTIAEQTESYLHVTAKTPTMKFTDDVQFLKAENGLIEARSSSRLGLSDLGANKARLDRIEQAIPELQ